MLISSRCYHLPFESTARKHFSNRKKFELESTNLGSEGNYSDLTTETVSSRNKTRLFSFFETKKYTIFYFIFLHFFMSISNITLVFVTKYFQILYKAYYVLNKAVYCYLHSN